MGNLKEIQELQRDKLKALNHENYKEAANVCNYLGVLLAAQGKLAEAIAEHKQELKLCQQLDDLLGIAVANRRLGECYSESQSFRTALVHLKQYLKIAINLKNGVEVQRAQTTLGRAYFLHFSADSKANHSSLNKAEFNFSIALDLTEK
jgi:NF-kappa-B inhibitor-like protein 2